MKQTLEEAAYDYATNKTKFRKDVLKEVDPDNYVSRKSDCMEDFQCGVEWQAKQSPWISVQETPPMDIPLLLRYGNGGMYDLEVAEYSGIHYYNIQGQILDAEITHWMPIPKFNE